MIDSKELAGRSEAEAPLAIGSGPAPSLDEVDPKHSIWMACPNCLIPGHFDGKMSDSEHDSDFSHPIWWNWLAERYECLACFFKPSANFNL
jgi:hypothetical protein